MTGLFRLFVLIIYACLIASPLIAFCSDKGGLSAFQQADFTALAGNVFPLLGLYAFVLLWVQIIIGSQMSWLRTIFPLIETFHRFQGVVILCLALCHPLLLLLSTGIRQYLAYSYVSPEQRVFAIIGQLQLFLLLLTVSTALLMRHPLLRERWRRIHYLNYLIFGLVLVHSWNLGSDLAVNFLLKTLWCGLGATAVISLLFRLAKNNPLKLVKVSKDEATGEIVGEKKLLSDYIVVAKKQDVPGTTGLCVRAENKDIAIFRINDDFFALSNLCTHAGGSLSKGSVTGCEVQCPAHGAKFDVRDGSVLQGPAKKNLARYDLLLAGEHVEVRVPKE
jgi:nitrite reductase/ring-hydroxylating ferredoxin subunit/DMSO/TMAO reductase YedYZ heme-binding membrane subunit